MVEGTCMLPEKMRQRNIARLIRDPGHRLDKERTMAIVPELFSRVPAIIIGRKYGFEQITVGEHV